MNEHLWEQWKGEILRAGSLQAQQQQPGVPTEHRALPLPLFPTFNSHLPLWSLQQSHVLVYSSLSPAKLDLAKKSCCGWVTQNSCSSWAADSLSSFVSPILTLFSHLKEMWLCRIQPKMAEPIWDLLVVYPKIPTPILSHSQPPSSVLIIMLMFRKHLIQFPLAFGALFLYQCSPLWVSRCQNCKHRIKIKTSHIEAGSFNSACAFSKCSVWAGEGSA